MDEIILGIWLNWKKEGLNEGCLVEVIYEVLEFELFFKGFDMEKGYEYESGKSEC